jgi:hypothetical protein
MTKTNNFFKKNNSSKNIEKTIYFIVFLLISFSNISLFAQGKKDTLRVLFVGNSYTHVNNLPQITSIISEDVNTKLITRESTIGGAKLREHWLGERGLKTKEKIKNGDFDIVVLQGYSMSTIEFPDTLTKYANLFCDFIKENGAKPVFYLTWARKYVPQYQEIIDSVYYSIAAENNVIVVPVGKAWHLAQKLRPNIELFQIDGSHPSNLGTLLSASVFVATITNEVPNKIRRGYKIKDINGEPILLMYFYNQELLNLTFIKKIVEKIMHN